MMQLDKADAGSDQVFNDMMSGAGVVALARRHLYEQNVIRVTQSHSECPEKFVIEQTDIFRRPRRSVLAVVGRAT